MNNQSSGLRAILPALLSLLFTALIFAQEPVEEAPPSPSDDKQAVTETEASKAEEATVSGAEAPPTEKSETTEPQDIAPQVVAPPVAVSPKSETRKVTRQDVIASLTIFVLAIFVGFEVITKVPPTLHTPLMSGSNAISGITLVGAVIVGASVSFAGFVGFLAVTLATINVVGGFLVTHRMLAMFKKK